MTTPVTCPLGKHIRRVSQLARSLEYHAMKNMQNYGDPARSTRFMESAVPSSKAVGRHFISKMHAGQLPDGARLRQYEGGDRRATCLCGCTFSRTGHIFMACGHPLMKQLRKHWLDDVQDAVSKHRKRNQFER